jgi:hypothetical protein
MTLFFIIISIIIALNFTLTLMIKIHILNLILLNFFSFLILYLLIYSLYQKHQASILFIMLIQTMWYCACFIKTKENLDD